MGRLGFSLVLLVLLLASPALAVADPLGPPEAAQLAGRILEGRVWLVHAVVVRALDGDVAVLNLDLGRHTWTLGRIVLRDGRDVGAELLRAKLAVPYEGGRKGDAPGAVPK